MLTRDQRYAGDALGRIELVKGSAGLKGAEYKSMAQELPVLVRGAGLVQALTFVQSRSSEAQKQLLEDVAGTLGFENGKALVEKSRTAPLPDYIRLTEQVIDALQWYKRLAQVVLGS